MPSTCLLATLIPGITFCALEFNKHDMRMPLLLLLLLAGGIGFLLLRGSNVSVSGSNSFFQIAGCLRFWLTIWQNIIGHDDQLKASTAAEENLSPEI